MSGLAGEADVVARLNNAISTAVANPRLAEVLAYELSVFYYGLFSWRDRPLLQALVECGPPFEHGTGGTSGVRGL
jgi:hypothetical protein